LGYLNANGLQDAGEPGVPGAVVHLLAGNCTTSLGQTTTDKNGIYFFPDLTPGSYCVQFDLPPNNALFTTKDAGDDARDSDAGTDGKSAPVTVVGGQPNLTVDAGLVIKSLSIKADPLCELDAPYLSYTVTPVNFTPGANPVTVRWRSADSAATVLYTMANLPLSGKLLWPEAGVDAQQHGNKWPGWSYDSTTQEWTDNGSQLRPNVKVEFSVNPTATVTVTYPPANPTCNPGPETNPTDLPSGEQPGQRVPSVFLPDVRGN